METDLVRVFSVTQSPTQRLGCPVFVITATKILRPDMGLQLQTVNQYAASICQRAKDLDRAVSVTWQRTKYGDTLRAAHLITVKEGAA